jgi:hypothetical protein
MLDADEGDAAGKGWREKGEGDELAHMGGLLTGKASDPNPRRCGEGV